MNKDTRVLASLAVLLGYMGKPSNGWKGLQDGDAVEVTVRVRVGDIREGWAAFDEALMLKDEVE